MYLFLDVETTGIPTTSDILEFAAIECSDDLHITNVINNYYFYDDEVPSKASQINGLTRQKLEFLAETDFIGDANNVHSLLSRPNLKLVGHNIIKYDLPLIKNNLHRAGYELKVDSSQCIDTLLTARTKYTGKHDLESTVAQVLADSKMSLAELQSLFESSPLIKPHIKDTTTKFHSGLFDAFVTFVIYSAWSS